MHRVYNCIVVFNHTKDSVLFCKRQKDPYKGKFNFVGGKVEQEEDSETADTVCIDKEIDLREIIGLAFIEDWYVNDSTMEILKEVKAIAPVRAYYHTTEDNQSELVKSIPFVMYLKNHGKGK